MHVRIQNHVPRKLTYASWDVRQVIVAFGGSADSGLYLCNIVTNKQCDQEKLVPAANGEGFGAFKTQSGWSLYSSRAAKGTWFLSLEMKSMPSECLQYLFTRLMGVSTYE